MQVSQTTKSLRLAESLSTSRILCECTLEDPDTDGVLGEVHAPVARVCPIVSTLLCSWWDALLASQPRSKHPSSVRSRWHPACSCTLR